MIVQDPTLLHQVDLFAGLGADGYLLVNTGRTFAELGLGEFVAQLRPERLLTVPATELAREHLGRPLPNAALLGGFAALTGMVSLDVGARRRSATLRRHDRRAQRRGRRRRVRARADAELGAEPCVARSKARRRSPRRSRSAGPR